MLLVYFAIGQVYSIKELIYTYVPKGTKATLKKYDSVKYLEGKKLLDNELTFSQFDIFCFIISAIICVIYLITSHWLTNNIIGVFFCIYAIKNLFLGNFKIGMGLLAGLFVYDIFWVFGTDVMITVAKNIEGPIKLLFPKKPIIEDSSDLSLLGLGDIVIPGIFVSLCMRFDFIQQYRKVKDQDLNEDQLRYLEIEPPSSFTQFWYFSTTLVLKSSSASSKIASFA